MRKRHKSRISADHADRRALRRREVVLLALVTLMMIGAWIVTLKV